MNLQAAQSSELEKSLTGRLAGDAFFDQYTRALYSTDASIYQIMPAGVIVPRNQHDVVLAVEAARALGLSLVPRGGGTSLSGQSIGPGLILDFSKYMNRIEIDPASRTRACNRASCSISSTRPPPNTVCNLAPTWPPAAGRTWAA